MSERKPQGNERKDIFVFL